MFKPSFAPWSSTNIRYFEVIAAFKYEEGSNENSDVAPKNDSDCLRVIFILIGTLHVPAIAMPLDYSTENSERATKVGKDLESFML